MPQEPQHATDPTQSLPVYRAEDLLVINGANLGDCLSFADELNPDDIYELSQSADVTSLTVHFPQADECRIVDGSKLGTPEALLHPDCCITVMPPTGETVEILILVEVDENGDVAQIYASPLAPLAAKTSYTLVGIDRASARMRMAQMACVSFSRGTRITMASGQQKLIEDLTAGDKVLTRDDGPQEIQWIGRNTLRAVGEFAPIVITKGTLNNAGDLVVNPDHRLFIYQRHDQIGAGRSELLVKARHLVNGGTVYVQEGGYAEYFQLVFDTHQIIFAEGICAETTQFDTRTRAALPHDISARLKQPIPGQSVHAHRGFEVHETLLQRPDVVELLRRSSSK